MRTALRFIFIVAAFLFIHQNAQAQIHFTAKLNGAQEVPAVTTSATGTGTFILNSAGTELAYHITFNGLSSNFAAAHFHNAAAGSVGNPPVRAITFTGNTASGVWKRSDATEPLTEALVKELLSEKVYVNVHSSTNPGGEIRGQVRVDYGIGLSAKLDGAQEVPAVTTPATGTGSFFLKSSSSGTVTELEYHVTVTGLSGVIAAAHFHNAPAGASGNPPVRAISFNGNTASGSWKSNDATEALTPALIRELLSGRIYVNVHTANNPGGEIRGQVLVTTGIGFKAKLDGAQEVPSINTTATGTGSFIVSPDGIVAYDVTATGLSGRITNAHFHDGPAGASSGPFRNLAFFGSSVSGVLPIDAVLLRKLLNDSVYVNVHTTANGGGEIRGQVKLNLGISFTAKLTGMQEAPNPVATKATGTGAFVLADGGSELSYQITYTKLSSAFRVGHFHNAAIGTSAAPVRDLEFTNNTANGSWKSSETAQPLTPALLVELLAGRIYVNIHSANFGGGEIRGQVLTDGNLLPLVPIGLARTLPDTTPNVNLQGVITTVDFQLSSTANPPNSDYYFQDQSGGMRLFMRGGKLSLPPGTLVQIKHGFVYTFSGQKNIEVQASAVEQRGTPGLPPPRLVTITQYKNNRADIEGQYIGLSRVRLKRGSFPATGNATLILTDASGDSLAMFIDLDTDIDGSPTPSGDFDVLGVATQFSGVAQIQPSSKADFKPSGSLPVELVEFRANAIGTDVELVWRTASETDNYGFEIQRKPSSGDFQKVGFVAGHGTTTQTQSYRFVDGKLAIGTYYYRLKQIDRDGSFSFSAVVEAVASIAPETFVLRQNHPNPFNPVTTIEFVLGQSQKAQLAVYDVLGHEVALLFDGQVEAGKSYRFEFDGAKQASGVYFYRLQSGERTQIRKMLLSK